MPGIITHNKILKESIKYLSKKQKKSYLLRSIETLFNTPEHLTAALFGSIGPNIFDYIPKRNKKNYYGNEISFYIHNGESYRLIESMIKKIYSYQDKNTEWAAVQRAYLYGFISHILSDSIFHPFVFYHSGFPDTYNKKEIYYYREQNLIFEYNIDNYYLYYDESSEDLNFSIDEMLPLKKKYHLNRLNLPIKVLLLESIKSSYPEIYKKIIWFKSTKEEKEYSSSLGHLDLIPYLIRLTYWFKRNRNRRLSEFIRTIRRRDLFFSDFIVRYPWHKRTDRNILNLHRGRWEYPSGKPGLHYESINNLLSISCEKTVELWEKIESSLYGKENYHVIEEFNINTYTNDKKLTYYEMKNKSPVRLRI